MSVCVCACATPRDQRSSVKPVLSFGAVGALCDMGELWKLHWNADQFTGRNVERQGIHWGPCLLQRLDRRGFSTPQPAGEFDEEEGEYDG